MFEIDEKSFVFDTPGFSSLFVPGMVKERLEDCFPEFGEYVGQCRFIGCAHLNEPDCAVKTALEDEKISISRYDNYKLMYQELKEKEKRYD